MTLMYLWAPFLFFIISLIDIQLRYDGKESKERVSKRVIQVKEGLDKLDYILETRTGLKKWNLR
jgi:hypothetical protein